MCSVEEGPCPEVACIGAFSFSVTVGVEPSLSHISTVTEEVHDAGCHSLHMLKQQTSGQDTAMSYLGVPPVLLELRQDLIDGPPDHVADAPYLQRPALPGLADAHHGVGVAGMPLKVHHLHPSHHVDPCARQAQSCWVPEQWSPPEATLPSPDTASGARLIALSRCYCSIQMDMMQQIVDRSVTVTVLKRP